MTAGVALDVRGRQREQLFHHINTSGFLRLPWECGSEPLAIFLIDLELLLSHLELEWITNSANKKLGKGEKLILIGQRILETGKWKL